ncbi:hypothetical protein G6F55_014659 [Rhizopus delemar]|nr:hypothetical protein G6F55_014659 [Rhizopus delemar]
MMIGAVASEITLLMTVGLPWNADNAAGAPSMCCTAKAANSGCACGVGASQRPPPTHTTLASATAPSRAARGAWRRTVANST